MPELNPILVKELRSRMRGPRAFLLISLYLLVLSIAVVLLYMAATRDSSTNVSAGREIGKALFLTIGAIALTQVCLITPTLTAGSIAGERERQSYDLLLASPLSSWQIVLGKLGAALAFALLMVLAVLPLMAMAFLFGGVSPAELFVALIALLVTCISYACVGIFWSAIMGSSLSATSFALGSVLLFLLGLPFLIVIFSMLFWQNALDPLNGSVFLTHLVRLVLGSHPFIALAFSETALSQGGDIWFEQVEIASRTVSMPNLWVLYVLISLVVSAILVLMSVRAIGPARSVLLPNPNRASTPKERPASEIES